MLFCEQNEQIKKKNQLSSEEHMLVLGGHMDSHADAYIQTHTYTPN